MPAPRTELTIQELQDLDDSGSFALAAKDFNNSVYKDVTRNPAKAMAFLERRYPNAHAFQYDPEKGTVFVDYKPTSLMIKNGSTELREGVLRLARDMPELRKHLLPLLKEGAEKSFEESIKGRKFKNPATGNDVAFGSLPAAEQKRVRDDWSKKNKKDTDKGGAGKANIRGKHLRGDAEVLGDAKVTDNAQVRDRARVSGNASVSDNASVYNEARVGKNAKISGSAQVGDEAKVTDNAEISGNAQISGDAEIWGNAKVSGKAQVSGDASVSGKADISGNAVILGGFWDGSEGKITKGRWEAPGVPAKD